MLIFPGDGNKSAIFVPIISMLIKKVPQLPRREKKKKTKKNKSD
jgi:hypothetical protein